ncbi:MAG: hypothetical protein ABW175_07445 [Bradyrhizobium sp.]
MIKALEQAITELSQLPEVDQEQISLKLLAHMEKLRALRADIDEGLRELDEGQGIPLDVEELIKKKNAERGRS